MWFNPFMRWLLRSPFHGFVSKNMMLMTYVGRKTGKTYVTPMNYVQIDGKEGSYLLTISLKKRVWWRNLTDRAGVYVRLAGKELPGTAQAYWDIQTVISDLGSYLQKYLSYAKYFNVGLGEDGLPLFESLERAAEERVVVRTYLENLND